MKYPIFEQRWTDTFKTHYPEVDENYLTGMFVLAEEMVRNEETLFEEYNKEIENKAQEIEQ